MSDMDKKLHLIIGKSKNPYCFCGVKILHVDYYANSNAWLPNFYKNWIEK